MKVNVVNAKRGGLVRTPVDISRMLHLEFEVDGRVYRMCEGELGNFPDQATGLYISVDDNNLIIIPRASNTIEVLGG